jgi:predicted hotdog family 3-hydroxylacyl-ACP dehydratase
VVLHTDCLDGSKGDLIVEAVLLMGDMASASYRFTVIRDGVELLSGRAVVVLEVAA